MIPKNAPTRLRKDQMVMLRLDAFFRSQGKCEMKRGLKERCNEPITWENSELAHIKSRGAGGSDTLDNVLMSCKWREDGRPGCHKLEHAGQKPCPKKERLNAEIH